MMAIVNGVLTALLLLIFIGIWVWAWSSRNKEKFDSMAQLPLEESVSSPTARSQDD